MALMRILAVVLKLVTLLAKNLLIVGLRTDFRGSGDMGVNLMLSNSCQHLLLATANLDSPPAKVTYFEIGVKSAPISKFYLVYLRRKLHVFPRFKKLCNSRLYMPSFAD